MALASLNEFKWIETEERPDLAWIGLICASLYSSSRMDGRPSRSDIQSWQPLAIAVQLLAGAAAKLPVTGAAGDGLPCAC